MAALRTSEALQGASSEWRGGFQGVGVRAALESPQVVEDPAYHEPLSLAQHEAVAQRINEVPDRGERAGSARSDGAGRYSSFSSLALRFPFYPPI